MARLDAEKGAYRKPMPNRCRSSSGNRQNSSSGPQTSGTGIPRVDSAYSRTSNGSIFTLKSKLAAAERKPYHTTDDNNFGFKIN
jgi:hypothetical protein